VRRLPEFEFVSPTSLAEVAAAFRQYGAGARLLAGGTDLIPGMREKGVSPQCVVNLKRLPGLTGISATKEGVEIGALTTIHEVETSDVIKERLPVLVTAAQNLGSLQVRCRATLGGNVCNASPAADMVPPLMALDARLTLVSESSEREVPISEFFLGPGRTGLKPGEILSKILVPFLPPDSGVAFFKFGRRSAMECAVANVAARVSLSGNSCKEARIALGSVGPVAFRARRAEEALEGRELTEEAIDGAAKQAEAQATPISDIRSTAEHRRAVAPVLVRRALLGALREAKGGAAE
jgi:carbon-monoxide dehydrogenase medium subunit